MQKFLLRDLDASLNAVTPSDKMMLIIEGTNDTSTHNIDLSAVLNNGAIVAYAQFKIATVASGVIASTPTAPGASATVQTVIICDPKDYKTL